MKCIKNMNINASDHWQTKVRQGSEELLRAIRATGKTHGKSGKVHFSC